jgi:hypothetical protein
LEFLKIFRMKDPLVFFFFSPKNEANKTKGIRKRGSHP